MIALDTETELIAPGRQAPPLVCVSLSDGERGELLRWNEAYDSVWMLLRQAASNESSVVGHAIAFDMAVLAAQWPDLLPDIFAAYEADRIEDTGIRAKLIDIAKGNYRGFVRRAGAKPEKIGYGLGDSPKPKDIGLVRRYLGVELPKEDTWRKRYGELRNVPIADWPAEAVRYAQDDAHATAAVWEYQETERARLLADQHRQARAAFWLRLTQCWGITTDPEAVRAFADGARSRYADLKAELIRHGLKRPDTRKRDGTIAEGARDTKVAMARVVKAYTEQGREVPLTDGGKPCTDDETCEASGDIILRSYGKFGSASKTLTTDVPILERGLIHARFDELKATGRTGTSDPNIQNFPRYGGHRECCVPRPGYLYAAADYSQFELRTWAQVCKAWLGYSDLADVLNSGRDPHLEMAAAILECSYEQAKALFDAGDKAADNARQTGKVGNFGFPGGLGADRFVHFAALQYGVFLTVEKAKALKALWIRRWREAKPYLALIGQLTDSRFPIIEQLYSKRYRGGVGFCDACNSPFQGLAADAAKSAGWLIAKAMYLESEGSILFGSRLVNFVHDEFIAEVPEEIAPECAEELARLAVVGAAPWLPDCPPVAEPVLMRRWTKAAKTKRDASGKLVVWEPQSKAT